MEGALQMDDPFNPLPDIAEAGARMSSSEALEILTSAPYAEIRSLRLAMAGNSKAAARAIDRLAAAQKLRAAHGLPQLDLDQVV